MKTKWGSCNHSAGHIRLNTELVKKPKDLLEYVIVHEMVHLIEPTHSDRFMTILALLQPVTLVGHSMGGLLCQLAASKASLRHLILMAPSPVRGMREDGMRMARRHP